MKIPQRQDQVALNAPQTQPGRAVQPVEGSLGDSYLTAMRGMSKELERFQSYNSIWLVMQFKGNLILSTSM